MAYSISQICASASQRSFSQRDKIFLAIDSVVLSLILMLSILQFSGVNTLGNDAALTLSLCAGIVIVIEILTALNRFCEFKKYRESRQQDDIEMQGREIRLKVWADLPDNVQKNRKRIKNAIESTRLNTIYSKADIVKDLKVYSHKIAGELYIGSAFAFGEACYVNQVKLTKLDEDTVLNLTINADNQLHNFQNIISICPYEQIQETILEESETAQKGFKENNVEWHHIGENIHDGGNDNWDKLAQHFETLFPIMDQAVDNNVPLLVHCRMGISRSATLVAAYFINRLAVPADRVIAYLQRKRRCINPEFRLQLERYDRTLNRQVQQNQV